jgi:hypothetical protein
MRTPGQAAVPGLRRLLARPSQNDRLDAACALTAIIPSQEGLQETLAEELLDQHRPEIFAAFLPAVWPAGRVALTLPGKHWLGASWSA